MESGFNKRLVNVFIFFHSLLGGGKCFQVLKLSQNFNKVILSSQYSNIGCIFNLVYWVMES